MRRALLALAAASAAAATPASAVAELPWCAARVTHAATDTAAWCTTSRLPDTGNNAGGWFRTITVEVAEGVAEVTYSCDTGIPQATFQVSGAVPVQRGFWSASRCTVRLRAAVPNTTAVVTSTVTYAFVLA